MKSVNSVRCVPQGYGVSIGGMAGYGSTVMVSALKKQRPKSQHEFKASPAVPGQSVLYSKTLSQKEARIQLSDLHRVRQGSADPEASL